MKNLSTDIEIISEEFNGFKILTTPKHKNKILDLVNNFGQKHKRYLGRGDVYKYKDLIIREYCHGGILRNFFKHRFLNEKRFIDEFEIILFLNNISFPTIKVCGILSKKQILSRGWLVSEELEAVDFINYFKSIRNNSYLEKIFFNMGEITKKLHNKKIIHNDLHLKNFLIKEENVFLIDFDKSCFSDEQTLKINDIKRFIRSVYKFNFYNNRRISFNNIEKFLKGYGLHEHFYKNVQITLKNKISWLLNKPKN